jgi:hypothetical protein
MRWRLGQVIAYHQGVVDACDAKIKTASEATGSGRRRSGNGAAPSPEQALRDCNATVVHQLQQVLDAMPVRLPIEAVKANWPVRRNLSAVPGSRYVH